MSNEVIQCLQDLYRLAAIRDDYTTQHQISSVVNNIEVIFFPSNGVAPHTTYLDVYLSNVFNSDNGLTAFIGKYFTTRTIQLCLDQIYALIWNLLRNYTARVIQYGGVIKDACMKGILSLSASSQCKTKCYACLEIIIPFLPFHTNLQLKFNAESLTNDVFKHLANARSKLSTTDLASLYTLFGLLGKHFSTNLCAPDKIIRAICDELNSKEVKTGSISVKILESCLTALSNLLSNTELKNLISNGPTYQNNIYTAIKCTLSPKQRVHTAFRACLQLFTDHTSLFSKLLIPEYQWWHIKFIELLSSFQGEEDRKSIALAVDKFYVYVARYVNDNSGSGQSVAIYKYFMDYFDRELSSQGSSSSNTQSNLSIKGLSRFVECNVATSNETSRSHLATMFYSFIQRTLFLSLELSKLEQNSLESNARPVSCYLSLLSKLIPQVTGSNEVSPSSQASSSSTQTHLNSLLNICLNLVSVYPSLGYQCANQVAQDLKETVSSLCERDVADASFWQTKFLQEFVYQSIIQTCSHNLVCDADILAENSLLTFRQYLPLWKHLLSNSCNGNRSLGDGRPSLSDLVLDSMMTCLLLFCQKLDLGVLLNPESDLSKSTFLPSLSHTYLRDPSHHLSPSNMSDLTLFSNLVDFYSELLTKQISLPMETTCLILPATATLDQQDPTSVTSPLTSNELQEPTTSSHESASITPHRLVSVLRQVITASMRHPVIGGLYSLVALLFKLTTSANCFEDSHLVADLSPIVSTYLDQVISISLNQQQELRYLCLSLLLVTPLCFIKLVIPHLVQPFKIIFELGLHDLDMAQTGVSVLTTWYSILPRTTSKDLIQPLVPLLNNYLTSRDSEKDAVHYTEAEWDILLSKSVGNRSKLAQMKKRQFIESCEQTSQLRQLQTSIIYFLSMLESNLAHQIVKRVDDTREDFSDVTSQRLLFNIPFMTMKVPIYLDIFLDRLLSLASSSSNRRLRVSACELLHSTILVLMGNNKQDGSRKGSERDDVFEKMFPVLLKLGCDGDILIRQLFSDLLLQMMHYYSSELQLCTSHTQFIITTLMAGITHESDTEVRRFSAGLLAELIKWSRKQSKSRDLIGGTKLNMRAVVKQIQEFCVHPASSKRIGAAIAFNNIYKVLREEVLFIDKYWLELFFYFVHNLVLCDSPGDYQVLCESFNHLSRVVKEKSQMFNTTNSERSKLGRFESGLTLDSFLQYLCEKLTHSNAFLRSVVRKIITDLSPHASSFTLETELPRIQSLIECQLFQAESVDLTQTELSETDVFQKDHLDCLNIALENYLWLMAESKQITQTVTDMVLTPQSKLYKSLYFQLKLLNSLTSCSNEAETLKLPAYKNGNTDPALSQLILSILKLSVKVDLRALDKQNMTCSGEHLFGEYYCRLVSKCLFQPYERRYNEEQKKELSWALDRILCEKCHAVEELANILFEVIYKEYVNVDNISDTILEPYVTRQNGVDQKQSSFLEAIVLIQKSGLLQVYIASINQDMVNSMLNTILQSLQLYSELPVSLRDYSQLLFNFVNDNSHDTMARLISCILNQELCPNTTAVSGRPMTKGHQFLTLLHSVLTCLLLKCHPNQLESLLLNSLNQEKVDLLIHLIETAAGPKRDLDGLIPMLTSSESSLLFQTLILSHWDTLVTFQPNDDLWLSVLTNIVHVKCHPGYLSQFQQVVNWYFLMLESPTRGIHDKLHYVKLLSSFLHNTLSTSEDTSGDTETRLLVTMETLLQSCDSTEEGKCNSVLLYTELQRGVTKCLNWGLLKLLAEFVSNNANTSLDFSSCVPPLLSSLGPAHFPSLISRLYSLLEFNEEQQLSAHARTRLLDTVFMACMRECYQRSALVEFYTENKMADILKILKQDVEGDAERVEQLLVTKLVAVRVMEGLLQVPKTDLVESFESQRKNIMVFIYKNILKSNSLFTQSDYCSYLNRELHAAAYVGTCVWIANTGADVDPYKLLFNEDLKGEKFIFKHFLLLDKEYKFPIEFNEAPREKKLLTGIRRQSPAETRQKQYESSIDLFSSSLADDVTRHDFTSSKLVSSPSSNNVTLSLELDEINASEPMQVLTALLHQMEARGLMSQPEDVTECGPSWLEAFISCLDSPGQEKNVRVWLIKLVVNCGDILARYATRLYPVLVRVITAGVLGSHINYFLNDILLVLLRWHSTSLPQPETAQDLLCFLFGLVHHANNSIVKYNLELIRNLLSVWKPILDPTRLPHSVILSLVTSLNPDIQYTGLKLSEILLVEQLPPYNSTTETNYLKEAIFEPWKKIGKDMKGNTLKIPTGGSKQNNALALVTGGLLHLFSEAKLQDKYDIKGFMRARFESMIKSGSENLVTSLYFVSRLYPPILDTYLNAIISSYSKVSGKPKEYCLNMIESVYKRNNKKDMWNTLRQMGVLDILEHKQHELLSAVLNLLNSIKNQLDPTQFNMKDSLLPLLRSLNRHVDSVNPQIRTRVFELVFDVYSRWFLIRRGERGMDIDEEEEGWEESRSVCKEMVLKGLLDNDQSLQDKNFARLSEHYQTTTPVNLLTQLFQDLYLPSMESHLLSFISYFLMDNTKHSADYSLLLFSHPLEACSYSEHRLLLSHRVKNLTYAPLFINSRASQLLALSSNTQTMGQGDTSGHKWMLRATNEGTLQFEPTMNYEEESVTSSEDDDVILDNSPPGSQSLTRNSFFKLSRRFVRNADHLKQQAIRHHSNRNWQRRLLLNEKPKLKSSQISLTRGYRTGDFPDIQISYSSVLNPLQSLVTRDRTLAQLLVNAVFMYLSQTEGSSGFINSSVNWFKHILNQGINDPTLTALILEICSQQKCLLNDDVISINEVAKTSGLLYHGILLTETKLLSNVPNSDKLIPLSYGQFIRNQEDDKGGEGSSRKKFKMADHHVINVCHTELIDMYKSLDETDIINGILSQQQNSNLKAALDAEQSDLYKRASKYYAACLQDPAGAIVAPYVLYDSYCQTFQWLSKWSDLEKLLEQEVQGNWHSAITKESYVMKHLLRCQILKSESPSESFLTAFKSWTESSPDHYDVLKLHHAQSTSILLLLLNQYPQCCHLAELNISQQLSTYKSRVSQINNLCVAMETSLLSKTLQFPNEYNIARLSNVWDMTYDGQNQEDLATLEIKVKQRKAFLDKMSTAADGNLASLHPNLFARNVANSLSLIRSAIDRNQFHFAREHLIKLESTVRNEETYGALITLYMSKVTLLSRVEEKVSDKKVDKIVKTWTDLGDPRAYEYQDDLMFDFYTHIHDLGSALFKCLRQGEYKLNEQRRNSLHDLFVPYGVTLYKYEMDTVQSCVFNLVVEGLKKTILHGEDTDSLLTRNGTSYLLLAEFIKSYSQQNNASSIMNSSQSHHNSSSHVDTSSTDSLFIQSLLRSIKCGTLKARQLFPLLLQMPSILNHAPLFESETLDTPVWMFLLWLNQILAYLDQDIGCILLPIVIRIATEYPAAIKLPFNINAERYARSNNPALLSLVEQLKLTPHETLLYSNLSKCTLPLPILRQHITKIYDMDTTDLDQVRSAVAALKSDCLTVKPDHNEAVVEECRKYKRIVGEVFSIVETGRVDAELKEKLRKLLGEKLTEDKNLKRNWELKQVSRYLSNYGSSGQENNGNGEGIEIPGQYNGLTRPMPRYHVKIVSFKSNIRVMQSIKKPIQITIMGNTGQEFPWLIKYNEDLRSDERIQAIFSLYNSGLRTDRQCVNRNLGLVTYRVVPLSGSSGMIQWVTNTRVLSELYQTAGFTKQWLNLQLVNPYLEFHSKCTKDPNAPYNVKFEDSMRYHSRKDIVTNFQSFVNKLPKFELRDGLLSVAKCPENRIQLRNNFVRSYACMCIAQYTLGIGDRHLENTLVCTTSGDCVGIDFGYSFGVATQLLSIPELVPFRLTPHILAINEPYGTGGLFRESMIRMLSCLRMHRDVILCALQVFIREPCSDWLVMLKRTLAREKGLGIKDIEAQGMSAMQWYPEDKIKVARQKLLGYPSTSIMIGELRFRSAQSAKDCSRIVSGSDACYRKQYETISLDEEKGILPVSEQIDCLLDHATDWGVLGVMYGGWAPFV